MQGLLDDTVVRVASDCMSVDDQAASAPSQLSILFANCEQRIDYQFRDPNLLQAALTHASGAEHRLASNERLEFLGDIDASIPRV